MSDLIGKTIGQYKITEQIGVGGMATVFKAHQASINRYVAVKILPTQFAHEPNFVKRFVQEAKAIATLEHPHILPMYDFGTEGDLTYMAMRYIEGGTLSKVMGQSLPIERIVDIVSKVARALEYAHSQGVVHRDIKPSNILIDKHNEPLLTDFGIAKVMEDAGGTQLTGAGSILGTPDYMSPEQAGGKPIDGRSDIYSLGVVLYELLTGRPPYQAQTPLAVVLMHVNEPLPPPRSINPDIAEPLERVLLKALAKDPNQRFQTAGEMEQALKDALKEIESTSSTTNMPVSKTQQELAIPSRSKSAPAKSGSMMGPLLIGGIVIAALVCVVGAIAAFLFVATSDGDGDRGQVAGITTVESDLFQATEETEPTPEPSDTPTPLPTATESSNNIDTIVNIPELEGEILLEERFDTNENDWFIGEDEDEYGTSEAEIVDGRYRLSQQALQDVTWWSTAGGTDFDDFVLSVEAMPVEQNAPFGYGLIFRNNFDEDFYIFEIDDEGFFVSLFTDGEWETLVEYTEMPAIKSNGPNQLVVEAIGPSLSFFINGQEAVVIEDDTLESGTIGVVLEIYEAGNSATIDFDNVIVRQISDEGVVEDSDDIIFVEYFDTDTNGWATGEFEDESSLDEITIEDGVYTLSVMAKPEKEPYVEKLLPNQEFSDFILTLEATPHDTAEHYSYGVSFRLNADGDGYSFEIGNDGLYAVKLYDGEWKTLKDWSSTDSIVAGETNELMVIAESNTLTFFVNGEELTVLEDDTVSEGGIGLIVDMFEENTSAAVDFDNLVIKKP